MHPTLGEEKTRARETAKTWTKYESYPVLVRFCGFNGFTQFGYGEQPLEVCINVFLTKLHRTKKDKLFQIEEIATSSE